jgi:hypothetical protein
LVVYSEVTHFHANILHVRVITPHILILTVLESTATEMNRKKYANNHFCVGSIERLINSHNLAMECYFGFNNAAKR